MMHVFSPSSFGNFAATLLCGCSVIASYKGAGLWLSFTWASSSSVTRDSANARPGLFKVATILTKSSPAQTIMSGTGCRFL
eukprot:3315604-Amphidinium_carterae.1